MKTESLKETNNFKLLMLGIVFWLGVLTGALAAAFFFMFKMNSAVLNGEASLLISPNSNLSTNFVPTLPGTYNYVPTFPGTYNYVPTLPGTRTP